MRAVVGKLIQGKPDLPVNSISIDTRTLKSGDLFFALCGPNFDAHKFLLDAFDKGACGIVVNTNSKISNMIKETHKNKVIIEVEDTVKALQDWARYLKNEFKTKNICVTGSTGKSTTKELISSILSRSYCLLKTVGNFNNEIGIPLTLFNLQDCHELLIVEMGMQGLGEISHLTKIVQPNIAVITNIGDSHIGLLGSRENIFRAKSEILSALKNDGIAVLNRDDDFYLKARELTEGKKYITYGIQNKSEVMASDIRYNNEKGMVFHLKIGQYIKEDLSFSLLGVHNVYNALAAAAVAYAVGMDGHSIVKGLIAFKTIKMHMQILPFFNGIKILNDAYNASPSSVNAALVTAQQIARKNRKIAILGDMLELGARSRDFHKKIGEKIANSSFELLFTVGEGGKVMGQSALEYGMASDHIFSFAKEEKKELSQQLSRRLKPNDFLLIKGSRGMEMEKIQYYLNLYYTKYLKRWQNG